MIKLQAIEQSVPLQMREQLIEEYRKKNLEGGVYLQTCNRIEFYSGDGEVPEDIANHLFSVTAGLKSSLIGESAVQGQVKEAYQKACETNNLSKSLHKLFQTALFVGKKVRSQTGISKGAMSHSQAAVDIAQKIHGNLSNAVITLVGINNINEKIIKYLSKKGIETIFIGNRTYAKAKAMAENYGAQSFKFDKLPDILKKTDVLISATSAPHLIVKEEMFPTGKKMVIVDLAVPRDVDKAIGGLENVHLLNVEQLEGTIEQNIEKRQALINEAKLIVKDETHRFLDSLKISLLEPVLRNAN